MNNFKIIWPLRGGVRAVHWCIVHRQIWRYYDKRGVLNEYFARLLLFFMLCTVNFQSYHCPWRAILNISCLGLKLHAKTTFTFWIWKIWEWLKIVKKLNCLNNHLHLLTIMIAQKIVIQKLSFPKKGSMAEWSEAWNVSEGKKEVDWIK